MKYEMNNKKVLITGASGGSAEAAGFMVSTSATTVIGFSLSGATIPSGEGVLVNVSFTGSGEACLDNAVLSSYFKVTFLNSIFLISSKVLKGILLFCRF